MQPRAVVLGAELAWGAVFVDQEVQENKEKHVDQIEHAHLQEGNGAALGLVEQAAQKPSRAHPCHHTWTLLSPSSPRRVKS